MSPPLEAERLRQAIAATKPFERRGRIVWAFGGAVRATGLEVRIGQACLLCDPAGGEPLPAEVIGLSDGAAILAPLRPLRGLAVGAEVIGGADFATVGVGPGLLGRVLDAHGAPLDGLGPLMGPLVQQAVYADAPPPLTRRPIEQPLATGVKVLDGLLTLGLGQRAGIFAAAGGGKSTLLGMIARHARSDVNVIALVGERGREVGDFIAEALGPEGLARSVVVVATSDRSAMERIRAANVATAIAEGFCEEGRDVVLMMDSVTRYARALREIGLAMGEPAVRRGFPPSVFLELPRLFERAGALRTGSITGLYTVLLEDELDADPIGEEVRSILDGHIYLSRKIAEGGRYPAVDVAGSISRLFPRLAGPGHRADADEVRRWMAKYDEIAFLRQVGEYRPGGDPDADAAIARAPAIAAFLRQAPAEAMPLASTIAGLREVVA